MDMKKFIVFLAAAIAGIGVLSGCDEVKIKEKRLPETARTFIQKNFPHTNILGAEKEREDGVKQYNVRLADGTEIEFDEDGVWTSVDCQLSQVPDGIVPAQILSHLQTYVPGGTKVFSIEKKWGGYEIGIQDGRDLIYDADGQFVREDR